MTRRKRYCAEFKREALRRANEEGVTDVLIADTSSASTTENADIRPVKYIPALTRFDQRIKLSNNQ